VRSDYDKSNPDVNIEKKPDFFLTLPSPPVLLSRKNKLEVFFLQISIASRISHKKQCNYLHQTAKKLSSPPSNQVLNPQTMNTRKSILT
jgi:hypothetical protein